MISGDSYENIMYISATVFNGGQFNVISADLFYLYK